MPVLAWNLCFFFFNPVKRLCAKHLLIFFTYIKDIVSPYVFYLSLLKLCFCQEKEKQWQDAFNNSFQARHIFFGSSPRTSYLSFYS